MVAIMRDVRVLEVAAWTYVPMAGAILAEWGAEVLKVEHPEHGDPQRGLVTSGLVPGGSAVAHMVELPNRGKRSIGIDLKSVEGREVLLRLAATADVFLTNFLPAARARLGIDVADIRAANPDIIYVRGSANGQRGPEADRGGYDQNTFWGRGGAADAVSPDELGYPLGQPGPAFGDVLGGLTLAGGIAAALYHRQRTGEALVVDSSLLAMGIWATSASIAGAGVYGRDHFPQLPRTAVPNPLVNTYPTADGRYVSLVMLESDRYWPELVTVLGRPELIEDARFASHQARAENNEACIAALEDLFRTRTLAEWKTVLADIKGVWSPVQTVGEVLTDPQVLANDYVRELKTAAGAPFRLVTAPLQFDETPPELTPAPGHGEDTDAVLLRLGLTMEEIMELKISGAVL